MEFFQRAAGVPARLGILPGAFNPVTTAHLALAEAGLGWVDEVLFVLPRELPHKEFTGATFAQRIEMLRPALAGKPAFSLASSEGGLFVDIAAECRREYGAGVRLAFLCGRDAAERIATWDYGRRSFATPSTRWSSRASTMPSRQPACGGASSAANPGNSWFPRPPVSWPCESTVAERASAYGLAVAGTTTGMVTILLT
jgi:hypothetical protein